MIGDVLEQFGTHLVVSSELGGIMDLTVNFSRTIKGELDMRAEDFADYFFKSEPSDFTLPNGGIQGMNSKVSIGGTFKILGGAESARQQIEKGIKSGSSNGSIDSNALKAWLESLECHSLDNTASLDNLMPVSFTLVPVWTLFPKTATGPFLKKMIEKSQQSNYSCQDYVTGTDYYAFPLNNASFMKFGEGEDQTLVRVLYASNNYGALQPVLEVCNEYVPAIRGDKRITIIYGIKNGRTFHGVGFFPGDGEGNPPAFLTFSDGDVYVKPIKEKDAFEKVDTVYYLHGNIYETNLGIDTPVPFRQEIVDQYLVLNDADISYPIVKLGSGYWTRSYIRELLGLRGMTDSGPGTLVASEGLKEGILFAAPYLWFGLFPEYEYDLKGIFEVLPEDLEKREYWSFPRIIDQNHFLKYIGNNSKVLFKGQVSGFEAEFEGYCESAVGGSYLTWYNMGKIVGRNTECNILFIDDKWEDGTALVLKDDYTWYHKTHIHNFYPIKLYRTSYYKYNELY